MTLIVAGFVVLCVVFGLALIAGGSGCDCPVCQRRREMD